MSFAAGDRVHLAGLGTGVVVEQRGADRYAIQIKGRLVIAAGRDLRFADVSRPPSRQRGHHETITGHADTSAAAAPEIDLHGKTTVEAVALVESFVNEALIAGRGQVRILHGRGSGRVQRAVHAYLRQLATVASFRIDPRNPGVTIVVFA